MRRRWFVGPGVLLAAVLVLSDLGAHSGAQHQQESPEALPVKRVRVRGADLAYIEQGRGEPVVLIHGWLGDYRVWSAQVAELSKHFRVIAYSRRYNYPNQWTGDGTDYSTSTDVADLVALIRTLKLGRVHLVGHSAGANLALLVARDHPELVRSVLLGEAVMDWLLAKNPEAQSLQAWAFVDDAHEAFRKGDVEGAARILVDGIIGKKGTYDEMPPDARRVLLDNLPLEMKAELAAPPKPEPAFTCEDARRIKAPALLLEGENTLKMFHLAAEELHKCMPGSERAILSGATHALELENPAGFNEIALEFLGRHKNPPLRHE